MSLTPWVRTTLWRSDDWRTALAQMAESLRSTPVTEATFARAFELGHAFELVEPDPARALAMFLVASRGGLVAAIPHARRLARKARSHAVIAELAVTEFRTTQDPDHLVDAGVAWIHAGAPERAVEPLAMAVAQRARDPQLQALLAAARRAIPDPHEETSRWIDRATRSDADLQPALFLHAAHLARALDLEELLDEVLQAAQDRKIGGELASLHEDRLLARGDADALLAFYRRSLETIDDKQAWVDHVCAAGMSLIQRARQVGLGLRLLRTGLERAYRDGITEVRSQLAVWELLVGHARQTRAMLELMPLIVVALGQKLGDDERLYLSRAGFEISWQGARDVDAARPYASVIAELVPDHPSLQAFMAAELPSLLGGSAEDDAMLRALANLGDADELVSLDLGARGQTQLPPGRASGPLLPPPRAPGAPDPAAVRWTLPPPFIRPGEPAAPAAPAAPASHSTLPPPLTATLASAPARPAAKRTRPPTVNELFDVDIDVPDAASDAADDFDVDMSELDSAPTPPPTPARLRSTVPPPPPLPPAALSAIRGGRPLRVPVTPPLRDGAAARASRRVVPLDVVFRVGEEAPAKAVARDISASGLFLVTTATLSLSAVLVLELRLPGPSMLSVASFRVSARIMRRDTAGYGLMFVEPAPELLRAIAAMAAASAE